METSATGVSQELDCVQIRQSGKDVEDKLSCRRAGLQVLASVRDRATHAHISGIR
jgi:hypothetical protein